MKSFTFQITLCEKLRQVKKSTLVMTCVYHHPVTSDDLPRCASRKRAHDPTSLYSLIDSAPAHTRVHSEFTTFHRFLPVVDLTQFASKANTTTIAARYDAEVLESCRFAGRGDSRTPVRTQCSCTMNTSCSSLALSSLSGSDCREASLGTSQ